MGLNKLDIYSVPRENAYGSRPKSVFLRIPKRHSTIGKLVSIDFDSREMREVALAVCVLS